MNPPIRKLTAIVIVMFLTLMGAVTYIQYFRAPELNADARNVRTLYAEYGKERGPIIVAGDPIVTSEPVDDPLNYLRTYHRPELYAPITGYFSTVFNSMTGMERAGNAILGGSASSLIKQRLEQLVTGAQPQGGGISLTIDPNAQEAAWNALGNHRGAVVAVEPSTGKILALVSKPSFDPNELASRSSDVAGSAWQALNDDPNKPLFNRAIAGDLYAPGSTFKIITAAAMIETLGLDADSLVDSPKEYTPKGTTATIPNFANAVCGDGSGTVPLRVAFAESCNTTFAMGGVEVGLEDLSAMANAFGFGESFEIPLAVTASRFPEEADEAALAMDAIGQRDVIATPLQIAMTAMAVANDGVIMKPYLIDQVLTADLGIVSTTEPSEFASPILPETAGILRDMMIDVVTKGTGRAAALSAVHVAGKTGTAEVTNAPANAWFVGFDATDNPQVVVAVVVEEGEHGGAVAGPIARDVISAVVND